MKHTVVTRVIAAPRAHVFDTFTTHTTYARLPGGRMAFRDVPRGTEVRWETSYDVPDGLAWKLATAGIALGNRGVLETLIRLLGREAEKTAH